MRDLLTFLMQDCCQGRPELCGDLYPLSETALSEELARD
jgi:hypothetical protein